VTRELRAESACARDVFPGMSFVEPAKYHGVRADYERSFRTLRSLPADIFLATEARELLAADVNLTPSAGENLTVGIALGLRGAGGEAPQQPIPQLGSSTLAGGARDRTREADAAQTLPGGRAQQERDRA
jgi:hypothetical protein